MTPRNARAAEGFSSWQQVIPPQPRFEEQCYYHHFRKNGVAGIYNPVIGLGLAITFDAENLQYFTQWKMMGERDYVLGLEPGNCHPDGRDRMRQEGSLTLLKPQESVTYAVHIRMVMLFIAREASVPVCVHLDHGETMEYLQEALDLGFTSIMYDGSLLPYEENVENTRRAVRMAAAA